MRLLCINSDKWLIFFLYMVKLGYIEKLGGYTYEEK